MRLRAPDSPGDALTEPGDPPFCESGSNFLSMPNEDASVPEDYDRN